MSKNWLRFAFDLGTNSIGWAVYRLDRDPSTSSLATVVELLGCGVRLFDDGRNPKDGRSLAEMRRVPRSARKRRDRYLQRRAYLTALLVDFGLMPRDEHDRKALVALDPYALRARGLDEALSPYELGRALFHLNQRRGFKSNRRTDRKADDKDKGKIADAAKRLGEAFENESARTFGEFLWKRHGGPDGSLTPRTRNASDNAVRIRLQGEGAKALYDYYPLRQMLEDEFDLLVAKQQAFHPEILTADAIAQIRHAIFWQRPLKPVERGRCTLVPSEPRLPKALPSVEERTIYETLNHLRYGEGVTRDKTLTKEQRDLVAATLLQGKTGKSVSFDSLRSGLKLGSGVRFSLEDGGKPGLDDYASRSAKGLADKRRFGARWHALPLEERDAIVERLIDEDDEKKIVSWLKTDYGLNDEAALAVATWTPREGISRLGKTANAAVLAELKRGVARYNDAVVLAGQKLGLDWHHSDFRDGVIELPLPYYGQVLERQVSFGTGNPEDPAEKRYGRLANPTAHIGLGQLRRLVNRLIEVYGEPAQIVIELARDLKLTKEQKDKEKRENARNRGANDLRRQELEKQGLADNGENRLRLRLFEEQQRANGGVALCPYSLETISIEKLFSSDVEIDHILPYSRTLDDTKANRVLCYRWVNRYKRRQTPYEAFGSEKKAWPEQPDWEKIAAAAAGLPANKRWRFGADAMERYENTERDFLARQINETRHLSRLARLYLGAVCGPDNVYVTTGQLTAMLRARWALNSILGDENRKVRTDHRHHAIDAITIGAIDRRILQEVSRRAGQAEDEQRDRITADVPDPFDNFRDIAREKVRAIIVSVKPEHGKSGALHEDTAYGLVKNPAEAAIIGNLVTRKPLIDLNANEIDRVRDPVLRKKLQDLAAPFRNEKGKLTDDKGLKAALAAFRIQETIGGKTVEREIRRVRIGKEKTGEVHIKDRRTGAVYKALLPGENHHIDIVQMRDGSWKGFAATVFEVNQKDYRPIWEREKLGGKLVMRLHKGDAIEVDDADGQRRIKTVHRLSPSNGVLYLAPHYEGGELGKRHDDKDDLFRWDFAGIAELTKRNARKVQVNDVGKTRRVRSNV
ncbi:type II CRISPR RNA-guided endonuclease Cas9 [Hyphomicrobium sp.]|jgi:CRISPR-associated endonuclease Csn1|uniref:type II CRISPR RNA-guided endonuclease Cas9 n=1 Tax=Hyphomicrobium sp. TaxID=82 RepID=UPI002BCE92FC|nr:type II CRISPR RNA-guided endonuclease Cas9 [Hyphomicrobium sp.]HVZ05632.1 type II CRISPR RNA-guided endonuclease Cas9 [Hyphomicrobium sp.]